MRALGLSWIPFTDAECKTLSFASHPVDLMNNSGTHTHASNAKQEFAVIFYKFTTIPASRFFYILLI